MNPTYSQPTWTQDSGYNTGITEVFEYEPSQARLLPSRHARDYALQQQQVIAEHLSHRDAADYQQEMLEHMMCMDVRCDRFFRTHRSIY